MYVPFNPKELEDLEITANGKTYYGKFSSLRIDRNTIPKQYSVYDIRDNDDGSEFCQIKNFVLVNHAGTFITDKKIPNIENGLIIDDYSFIR